MTHGKFPLQKAFWPASIVSKAVSKRNSGEPMKSQRRAWFLGGTKECTKLEELVKNEGLGFWTEPKSQLHKLTKYPQSTIFV